MAYNRTRYTRGVVTTLSAVNSLSSPQLGETCFCSENGRVMTYDGQLWMCDDFIKATNVSGATRGVGDLMTWQTTAGTTTAVIAAVAGSFLWAGVAVYAAANNAPIAIAYKGIYKVNIAAVPVTYNRLGYQLRISSTPARGELIASGAPTWAGWNVEIVPGGGLTKCLLRGKPEYV